MLLEDYRGKQENTLYASVMQVILKANDKHLKGDDSMCDALKEVIQDNWMTGKRKAKKSEKKRPGWIR